jgi:hypothetical protein
MTFLIDIGVGRLSRESSACRYRFCTIIRYSGTILEVHADRHHRVASWLGLRILAKSYESFTHLDRRKVDRRSIAVDGGHAPAAVAAGRRLQDVKTQ